MKIEILKNILDAHSSILEREIIRRNALPDYLYCDHPSRKYNEPIGNLGQLTLVSGEQEG